MKLGFVTCVQLGLSCIEAIYEAGYGLKVIFTLHDDLAVNKSGRVFVDDFAEEHGITVHKLAHVNDVDAVEKYGDLDWLFIIGWSQIAGPSVINAPKEGVLGIHPTLLPEGRGRAAIPWAIIKGLTETGVTMFKLDEGVDTGPILGQLRIPLDHDTTAARLYEQVNEAHKILIQKVLPELAAETIQLIEQDESKATIWPGRRPEDGLIDLRGPVDQAERLIRAVTKPYPGAYYIDSDGQKVIVWSSIKRSNRPENNYLEFKDGYLELLEYETIGRT